MTNPERFQKAVQAILTIPPEQTAQINRQTEQEYEAGRDGSVERPRRDGGATSTAAVRLL